MKRTLFFAALFVLAASPLAAQTAAVGFQLGISAMTDEGVDFDDFDDTAKEIWLSFDTDGQGTVFKIKAGEVESNDGAVIEQLGMSDDGTITYVDAIVEYRFSEVFGASALFAGIGGYRQEFGDVDDSAFGGTVGANAVFPVTRRFGIIAEVAYHWVDFDGVSISDDDPDTPDIDINPGSEFLVGSVGVRFAF